MVQAISELSEQAKRLRCGAEVVFDGAAPVAVPVPQRLTRSGLAARLGSCMCWTSRSSARWRWATHRSSTAIARSRRRASPSSRCAPTPSSTSPSCCTPSATSGRPSGGKVSLNVVSESLLHDLLRASPSANLMVEVPAFMASDPANVESLSAPARGRQHAAAQGPAARRSCRAKCCRASSTRSSTSPTIAGSARPRTRRPA